MKHRTFKSIREASLVGAVVLFLSMPLYLWAHEERFDNPDDAVTALKTAAEMKDMKALDKIFGSELHKLVSPDEVQASNAFNLFMRRISEKTKLNHEEESKVVLQIGYDGWPFPIPIVEEKDKWFFDTAAGKEEILNRRIGMDELGAIRVCNAYVDAQREYASEDHTSDGVMEYAQHLRSSPGQHDGLYWHAEPGEEASPLGPLIAEAHGEGYQKDEKIMTGGQKPYHGYSFKILTRQGKNAPGGKYDYIINGHMIAGFALVAWPEKWGNTGVMTFIVNQQGKVYEKDLGHRTESIARGMTTYDPDSTWKLTDQP
jgi:hypothetical protein